MAAVISPMLRRLALERATGALLREHGTLYLADGQVVHAESRVAPGPEVLLGPNALPGRTADGRAADGRTGDGSVGRGRPRRVGAGEWEICRLGAFYDAAFFALAPGSGPARFRYGEQAAGTAVPGAPPALRPVPAADVERETLRRRTLLDRVWPHPAVDTAPVVPRPVAPGRTVTARGRALLARADGVRTPAQLAVELRRPAFHTVLEVRRLAAAGLVETPPSPAPVPAPVPAERPPPFSPALTADAPDLALLRRVRDALEALP
ncbi:transcriptional regulator [Streptomyces coeruleoprunus]|uniref:Transcriptional regulator n=1 Tax=Streptomyces coeruleoprunus TaxID=285563 RepID=A0ABV9XI36_9ACTN